MFDELEERPEQTLPIKWILLAIASVFLAIFVFGLSPRGADNRSSDAKAEAAAFEESSNTWETQDHADFPLRAAPSLPVSTRVGEVAQIGQLPVPAGFQRIAEAGEMATYCRSLALKPKGTEVRLFNGKAKANQRSHVAVLEMDVGKRDLQQCADAVMRIRAEYLFQAGRADDVSFNFTSGDACAWSFWKEGWRPVVQGNEVEWDQSRPPADDYDTFRNYLDRVFVYAGSASLSQEMEKVAFSEMQIGDVLIQGGFPGHAVIVLDMAQNARGKNIYLLAQSFTPAQDIHVIINPSNRSLSPWYDLDASGEIVTPEWTFKPSDLKRFR